MDNRGPELAVEPSTLNADVDEAINVLNACIKLVDSIVEPQEALNAKPDSPDLLTGLHNRVKETVGSARHICRQLERITAQLSE